MSAGKVLAVVVLCVGCGAAQNASHAAAIDLYLDPYVQSGNFSGSVLVESKGKVVFQKAYGFADRENKILNTGSTRFHIASISMQFTAAAILRLVDEGVIGLDTRVSDLVAGIADGDKITVGNLLLERSGLPDINELPAYGEVLEHHQTASSLVAYVKGRPLLFEPGSKFMHEEHSAYNLLALIVEKKTGLAFGAAIDKLVLRPAGLSETLIDDDAIQSTPHVARGYQPDGVYGLKPAAPIHWSAKTGNASVLTTTGDEARFVGALLSGGLLQEQSRQAILATSQKVGYGWMRSVSSRYQEATYYMNGRAPGFASFVVYLPREQMTVVVFSNIYSSATTTIGNDIAAISLGLPYEPFETSEPPPTAKQIKACIGTFRFGPDFYQPNAEVTLVADGAMLSLRWPSQDVSPLIPIGPDRFMDRSYWEEVKIERGKDGNPETLLYGHFRGSALRPN